MATRLGIVGGGQLGRMLALAAAPLGIECAFVDPSPDAGARVAARQIQADYENIDALIELAEWSDVVTFEFENVSAPVLEAIAGHTKVAPSPRSLEVSQDRLLEKQLFESLEYPIAPYRSVDSLDELESALADIGTPAILKTRRLGYDGKGQVKINSVDEAGHAWKSVESLPCVLEGVVEFDNECSMIAIRGESGDGIWYPLTHNKHHNGILVMSRAPIFGFDSELQALAAGRAMAIAEELGHVGAIAVEYFNVGNELLINEIAPRVHNSGHWTIDGCSVSQFENHVRAVTGLPLGAPGPITETFMINLVGGIPASEDVLAIAGAKLHLYDKEPRPGRKVGHVNVLELDGEADLKQRAGQVLDLAKAVGR